MIRSAAIYDEHPDLNAGYLVRWTQREWLSPLVKRRGGDGSPGHDWPDWTLRMIRLVRSYQEQQAGRPAGHHDPSRVVHRLFRETASLMDQAETDDEPLADWYVSVDGDPVTAVDTAEGVADLLRGATCATILAVPA